ncbi:transposase [Enterovibrio paralichthyis]|uniref:transposase n=1 Tax=Enterovibrio paralichthyis TaxID=2853805 RepID=UPI001C456EF3|nr:transposase [Enterovibrio paralichthyis]MBV7297145.1 transposase [Enterovibrio paralichthyis]
MTKARSSLISIDATPYYHCVSRCVRRSFLCGVDESAGKSFEHRRGWIEKRLLALSQAFCVDVCAYAIMSNHYHVVLHINTDKANALSPLEVAERWLAFHQGPTLIQRWLQGGELSDAETARCLEIVECWRGRLTSISWFMRLLNQHIAVEANREDGCTGHFWEGRFKSQALLDEKALAAAMAYVDLNPVRAAIAETPEQSEHTSVKARIEALRKEQATAPFLFPFVGNPRKEMPAGLPFRLMDYLELVEWTGRQLRDDKSGHIDKALPPLLERLGLEPDSWLDTCTRIERGNIIGTQTAIQAALPHLKRHRVSGLRLPDH